MFTQNIDKGSEETV